MTGARTVDGILRWRRIGKAGAANRPANTVEHCLAPVRIVEIDTPLFDAVRGIVEEEVVLVRAKDRTICGLVSAQDIATQFVTLSEPFPFLKQIENHLHAILEKVRLTASEVKELVNPTDTELPPCPKGTLISVPARRRAPSGYARSDRGQKLQMIVPHPRTQNHTTNR